MEHLRIGLKGVSTFELKNFVLQVKLEETHRSFLYGLRVGGARFLISFVKYCYYISKRAAVPLKSQYLEVDFQLRTIYPYLLEN